MVRSVEKKYQVWLAGYYDDFNGARAIPDDLNKPSDTTYSVLNSHFGNPMNGEAFLNPRWRFSAEERNDDSALNTNNSISTDLNRYLQNDGIFEWLTWDDTRLSYDDWEGRAQLQYPDGHIANRYKFNNDSDYGTDFYQRFINGHNSDASYIVPVGDNDATFGKSDMQAFSSANYETSNQSSDPSNAGLHSTTGDFVQRAHLTGVWMGERLEQTSTTTPNEIYQEIHSPSKQPFLCIQAARKATGTSATIPSIIYDGPLNTRINGDVFTARVALQSAITTGSHDVAEIKFEIGFPTSEAADLLDGSAGGVTGYGGVPAITYTLDLDAINYDTAALLGGGSYNTPQVSIDNAWLDVDFVFDYSSNEFDVYVNGVSHEANQTMSGGNATTASDLYGYQMTVLHRGALGTSSANGLVSYLMIDRVGLVRYLTDDFTTNDELHIMSMDIKKANNAISSCKVKVADDPALTSGVRGAVATDYLLNLRSLFVASSPLNWELLVFGDSTNRIDRPVWRGEVSNYTIKQRERSREMIIAAKDSISMLDRQIPLWDVGQHGEDTEEDATDYWPYDAQGFRNSMYLGANKLRLLDNDVGFDVESSFIESATQRMQLGSGHPIQMYNNEDDIFGPNNAEGEYEGVGIIGVTEEAGVTTKTTIHLTVTAAEAGITDSTPISIINTQNHNCVNKTPDSVTGNRVIFNYSDLTYTPESSKIVYIGKYPALRHDGYFLNHSNAGIRNYLWGEYDSLHPNAADLNSTGPFSTYVYFSSDPELNVGDYFYINNRNIQQSTNLNSWYQNVRHRVDSVASIRSYFTVNNGNDIWIVKINTAYAGETHGDYPNDALLSGNARFEWTRETGQTLGVFPNYDLRYRAIHSRWMRDLPQSLWFKYHFGKIKKDYANKDLPAGASITMYSKPTPTGGVSLSSTTKSIKITQKTYENFPNSGVVEIWASEPPFGGGGNRHIDDSAIYQEKFIYEGKAQVSSNYYLIGVKYINGVYPTDNSLSNTQYFFRVQDIDTDYKHLWLLWSDMRNNGNSNADGSERKSNFGLQYPVNENYSIDMYYADQVNADGNPDLFANLHIGEDLDIWNIDATSDPFSGGAFSKPVDYENKVLCTIAKANTADLRVSKTSHGLSADDYVRIINSTAHDGHYKITTAATHTFDIAGAWTTGNTADTGATGGIHYLPIIGSHTDLSDYQDWEDKAGAFLVLDAAKFFNMNTHANDGRSGQESGQGTDLTDYIATSHGFPKLIDNYWAEAISSYQTTPDEVSKHPAQYRLISDATNATDGFVDGYIGLPVDDATNFDTTGAGKLVAVMARNENEETTIPYYFVWNGKLETEYSSDGGISTPPSESTYEGETVIEIANLGETHSASGLTKGMTLKRTPSGGDADDITVHTILRVVSDTQLTVTKGSATWGAGDTYTVPVQLAMVYAISLTDVTGTTTMKEAQAAATTLASSGLRVLENTIWEHFHNQQLSWSNYGLNMNLGDSTETTPQSYEVHATVSSQYMLRLLMHMKGFYANKNGGTYWDSDKFRMLWNASIMKTWLPSAKVGAIFDINNVPITKMMTTYSNTSSNDAYGSIMDSRGKTLGATLKAIQEKAGHGVINNTYTTFSYLIGKDNRFEFRPKYNSGLVFNRDNIRIASLTSKMDGQITNVRVYYNNGSSFVDWPATNLTDSTRWKIVEYPIITGSEEALFVAKQEYNKKKESPLKLTVEPQLEGDVEEKMIESGRYGYIADPYIALYGNSDNTQYVTNWSFLGTGGALFPGMVNALDGNMNADTDPIKDRYGSSKDTNAAGAVEWAHNYYWYGSNSISNAVQIVHIPNKTPVVSAATSQPMRIWVDLKNQTGTDIDNAEFVVHVADYSFSGKARAESLSGSIVTKDVKHSGFYEIDFPSNYGAVANAKIVFSFNAEYCRALLRHRCGNPTQTTHTTADYILDSSVDNGSGSTNTHSIFPLGKRVYSEMGGGFRNQRAVWYAPRIQICRDLSYSPATYVSVTDAGLELNAEPMVIKTLMWGVRAGRSESVSMELERDESLAAGGLISYLFPDHDGGRQDGVGGGGGGGGGGNDDIDNGNGDEDWKPGENTPSEARTMRRHTRGATQDSTGTAHSNSNNSVNLSRMSSSTYGRIKGRMDFPNDSLSGGASFSILGQKKPAVTPSTMRGIEGMDMDIRATSGTASVGADGYVFGGKGLMGGEASASSKEVTIETTFVLPEDILSNKLNIQATVTHSPVLANNTNAVLYVTALIEETGESITNTVNIGTGIRTKPMNLIPTTALSGLNSRGNHIKITITRKPGIGDDDADTTSITLHNLHVKMQRASAHTTSNSSQFSTL